MNKEHHVILIPGLGDGERTVEFINNHWNWKSHGFKNIICPVGWHDGKPFHLKIEKLSQVIQQLQKSDSYVSLIGMSAGGSAAFNAYIANKEYIHRVVNICGRLRKGRSTGFRSFSKRTETSPSFAESVLLFEYTEPKLTVQDKRKMMTVAAKYGDELVPYETIPVDGARNIQIPSAEHGISIALAMTVYSQSIREFLKEDTLSVDNKRLTK